MQKLRSLIVFGFLLVFWAGCNPNHPNDGDVPVEGFITLLSEATLEISPEGGRVRIGFSVSGDWSIRINQGASWCSVAPQSGPSGEQSITATAEANTSGSTREANISITCGEASVIIVVTQREKIIPLEEHIFDSEAVIPGFTEDEF